MLVDLNGGWEGESGPLLSISGARVEEHGELLLGAVPRRDAATLVAGEACSNDRDGISSFACEGVADDLVGPASDFPFFLT